MNLIKIVLFFAAGMSFAYYLLNREDIPEIKKQVSKVVQTQNEIAKESADNFVAIYNRLGLKHGDMIKKVNDFSVVDAPHKVFSALKEGFKKGNVCVYFQRDGEDRKTCLKTTTKEDVTNQPVTAN